MVQAPMNYFLGGIHEKLNVANRSTKNCASFAAGFYISRPRKNVQRKCSIRPRIHQECSENVSYVKILKHKKMSEFLERAKKDFFSSVLK